MKIGFVPVHLSERGTTIAVYDYANHNEKILNNTSIIFYQKNHPENFYENIKLFNERFQCYEYVDFAEVDEIVKRENIVATYIIKYGTKDNMILKNCKTLVHSVFANDPHGDIYAFISSWLSFKYGGGVVVPHMIDLPHTNEDLRSALKIPKNALVFGSYGGKSSFDITFVHRCIERIINENPNIYFLFMNIIFKVMPNPRIMFINATTNRLNKVRFINTCDAMIHARNMGESFGLSIGEFSTKNKPIITYFDNGLHSDKEHIRILQNKGIYYTNSENLMEIFRLFKEYVKPQDDWNCYKDFTPERVMDIFKNVYLNSLSL